MDYWKQRLVGCIGYVYSVKNVFFSISWQTLVYSIHIGRLILMIVTVLWGYLTTPPHPYLLHVL